MLRRLIADGFEVVVFGRAAHLGPAVIEPNMRGRVVYRRLDLLAAEDRTLRSTLAETACDQLIHAAWYTNHADYLVAEINRAWLAASRRLFDAFRQTGGGRIVGLGTCIEYQTSNGRLVEALTPLEPDTLYGECKKALSEHLLALPDTAWGRIFFVYGPGDRAGRLVPHLIDLVKRGQPVSVRYGGMRRDYIHIDDLAAQVVALIGGTSTGPFNLGTGQAVLLSTLGQAVATAADRPDLVRPNSYKDTAQPPLIEADMSRYTAEFGTLKIRSLVDGLGPLVWSATSGTSHSLLKP